MELNSRLELNTITFASAYVDLRGETAIVMVTLFLVPTAARAMRRCRLALLCQAAAVLRESLSALLVLVRARGRHFVLRALVTVSAIATRTVTLTLAATVTATVTVAVTVAVTVTVTRTATVAATVIATAAFLLFLLVLVVSILCRSTSATL